ncbi:hypothetical protein JM93_00410 [Roseibium hamelinense]|uniref:Uncharacterized protein n=1 Tax=Roseibium hamelinense TaxID=150831 RepID=A0A562TI55_9HYPH|nr:hypothetical protein JM93_00410 [Roseibium hamelinense]
MLLEEWWELPIPFIAVPQAGRSNALVKALATLRKVVMARVVCRQKASPRVPPRLV